VKLYVPAGATFPLLKALLSLVIVCVVPSLFVQVTLVPDLTVSGVGENEKLAIVIEALDAAGDEVGDIVGVDVGVVVPAGFAVAQPPGANKARAITIIGKHLLR
jgi:hypothetical protein